MTDETTPASEPVDRDAPNHGAIEQVDLQLEMQRSYLDYAMSVIVGRALPEVRDGLKPVHRRVLYAMYDGGYRPDKAFSKCSRVVGDVMGQFHPHGDSAIYDALVRLVQPWSLRYPLALGQGNFGSAGDDEAAAPRYTETKMAPLAMEMVRDIDEDTVDFQDNYDGRTQEPSVLPARFPNLLVNGSVGIAVGMATNIPPHNLREVAAGAVWHLEHPDASREELLEALIERIQGPDFPTGAQILGTKGIQEAYRTGRGSITMRAVVTVEEVNNRTALVITELPYQVNPDNLARKIAELVKDGRLQGIADIEDQTSGRTGQRLVITLKRDAVAKVVLNNLYKHTQLQENFGANMLAIVDGVPRTLPIDGFITHWADHQVEVIVRRTQFRLAKAEERMHILRGYLKALDALDEVIALIRRSQTTEAAREGLMELLEIDRRQSEAILELQLRRLAALERQKIQDEANELETRIADYRDIIASPSRQRQIIVDELTEIVDKFGDDRRTEIMHGYGGDVSMEDLIPEEQVVVSLTTGGYIKRTRIDQYRAQHRGGKGVRGAQLRSDDVVEHFSVNSTHDWMLFFTNLGRVYRMKAYEIAEAGRDAKGQHVANLLAFQPDEQVQTVLTLRSYQQAEYLVLATRDGQVKKTRLELYDTNRTGGIIAINLADGDRLISAMLANSDDEILVISKGGRAARFEATDEALRPMGRATGGVRGIRLRDGDEALAAMVIGDEGYVFVVTEQGFGKKTAVSDYPTKGRGTQGVLTFSSGDHDRGELVGATIVHDGDELLLIRTSGKVIRSSVDEVRATGRTTMGVQFAEKSDTDLVIQIARNVEEEVEEAAAEAEPPAPSDGSAAAAGVPADEAADAAALGDGAIVDAGEAAAEADATEETDE